MNLPVEILCMIYKLLPGKDIVRCRRVCLLWRDAVDSLSDFSWKEIFFRDKGKAEIDIKMARLSYKEMYKSMSLWAHVKSAVITPNDLPADNVLQFKILDNGILSVLQNNYGDVISRVRCYGDTLIYYDLDTLKEVARERFNFQFSDYSENDIYISAIDMDQNLCVIPKANKKRFYVGKLDNFLCHSRGVYTPCYNEVYFKNIHDIICVSKVVKQKGKVMVKTEQLDELENHVLAFCLGLGGDLYVLTIEGTIYRYKDRHFQTVAVLEDYSQRFYYQLDIIGFDWSSPYILNWKFDTISSYMLGDSRSHISAICRHGNVVIKAIQDRNIKIFYEPYKVNGDLKTRVKPNAVISMEKIDPITTSIRSVNSVIKQIFVVEKLNGHKLIVLTAHRLIILHLDYKETKKKVTVNKKRARTKSSKKTKKTIPKNPPAPTRRYNTRSSTRN